LNNVQQLNKDELAIEILKPMHKFFNI